MTTNAPIVRHVTFGRQRVSGGVVPHVRLDPVFAHGISLREPAGPADIDFEEVE